jgi:hypothetical protein
VITVGWVFFVVPEMKGFALEQLDHLFAEDVPTRQFASYEFSDEVLSMPRSDEEEAVVLSEKEEKDLTTTSVRLLDKD